MILEGPKYTEYSVRVKFAYVLYLMKVIKEKDFDDIRMIWSEGCMDWEHTKERELMEWANYQRQK